MAQIPPNIFIQSREKGSEAADYLEKIVNEHAQTGWEFVRIDSMSVTTPAGCLAPGKAGETNHYHVITFRRPR